MPSLRRCFLSCRAKPSLHSLRFSYAVSCTTMNSSCFSWACITQIQVILCLPSTSLCLGRILWRAELRDGKKKLLRLLGNRIQPCLGPEPLNLHLSGLMNCLSFPSVYLCKSQFPQNFCCSPRVPSFPGTGTNWKSPFPFPTQQWAKETWAPSFFFIYDRVRAIQGQALARECLEHIVSGHF